MSSDQMPAPGKIKLIKFPPPGQEKTSNARGMPGRGGDVEASIWLIHYDEHRAVWAVSFLKSSISPKFFAVKERVYFTKEFLFQATMSER